MCASDEAFRQDGTCQAAALTSIPSSQQGKNQGNQGLDQGRPMLLPHQRAPQAFRERFLGRGKAAEKPLLIQASSLQPRRMLGARRESGHAKLSVRHVGALSSILRSPSLHPWPWQSRRWPRHWASNVSKMHTRPDWVVSKHAMRLP